MDDHDSILIKIKNNFRIVGKEKKFGNLFSDKKIIIFKF